MAQSLQSPGVSVSVIDQSFYTPAAPGTVPMIFVATAENKTNASGTGIAAGTMADKAGCVWVITSQRDLTDTFGVPYFETDAEGNPVNGGEINEYGLQAAYSLLGASSQAYVVRADIDLGSLKPQANIPTGAAVCGTYWLDTSDTLYGINEWNATTGEFAVVKPLVIDDSNADTYMTAPICSGGTPVNSFGSIGSYAVVATSANENQLFYYSSGGGWVVVQDTFDGGKRVAMSPHYQYPDFTNDGGGLNAPTGSIWVKTTTPGKGANWDFKSYSSTTKTWTSTTPTFSTSTVAAIGALDPKGGGLNIALKSVFVNYNYKAGAGGKPVVADFQAWTRYRSGPTTLTITSSAIAYTGTTTVKIRESLTNGIWGDTVTVSVTKDGTTPLGQLLAEAINGNTSFVNIRANWNSTINQLTITHEKGGDFEICDGTSAGNFFNVLGVQQNVTPNVYYAPYLDVDTLSGGNHPNYTGLVSNWKPLVYEARPTAPSTKPANGQLWYDNNIDAVDIMYNDGTAWRGYMNAFEGTDPNGPIIAALAPLTQSDGITALVTGDIWVDSSNPDEYGQNIYVYNSVLGVGTAGWVKQDVTDHTSPNGWVFADARWGTAGSMADPATVVELLSSDFVDFDCPDPAFYPRGTRLWNTRRSGYNVKKYIRGYINKNDNNTRYNESESMSGYFEDRWVTTSANNAHGVGSFGRLAQRSLVVESLKALVTANTAIRDSDTLTFNLIAAPGYPELIQNMVEFNTDVGLTAFVVGDSPFRLTNNATTLKHWGSNAALATDNGDDGLVTNDSQLGVWYPSGYTNDNLGRNIVVPPSHMILRTIVNNDNVAYPWFAPAGTRRGVVDNASSVGYVDPMTGEFVTASLYQSLRDVLSSVEVNPIATLPGVGLTVMGQKTRASNASALDRVNVSRLICYLRRQLAVLAKPYLFEPNDSQTRHEVTAAVNSLLLELVSQRALYDYVVVCDTTNNTPARIDRNELWVDIAIEPVKAVEFIYIPLRILNTGAISSGNFGSQSSGSGA